MLKIKINLNTDNDSFIGDPKSELRHQLEVITSKFVSSYEHNETSSDSIPLFDVNGNRIGDASFINEPNY